MRTTVPTIVIAAAFGVGIAATQIAGAQTSPGAERQPAGAPNAGDTRAIPGPDPKQGTAPGASEQPRTTTTPAARDRSTARVKGEDWARTHRASKIIGTDVRNRQGEKVGDVEDVVIDPRTGQVSYAVVSMGGFLGMGDKLYAVPWRALHSELGKDYYVMDANKERMKNAPGFDKNNWPDMGDPRWNQDVHKYYNQRWQEPRASATGTPRPASNLGTQEKRTDGPGAGVPQSAVRP